MDVIVRKIKRTFNDLKFTFTTIHTFESEKFKKEKRNQLNEEEKLHHVKKKVEDDEGQPKVNFNGQVYEFRKENRE